MNGVGGEHPSRSTVRLELIDAANRKAVRALELGKDQQGFLADNASSLIEARNDQTAHPRAIVVGNRVVGFLMYDASGDECQALLYRFMIDRHEQGRGYGRAALALVLDEIEALGNVCDVFVCYMPENVNARRLWVSAGFVDEGLDEDGEMIARLHLARRGQRS